MLGRSTQLVYTKRFFHFLWLLLDEAGATFDNPFFDNSFGFLRQFKNRSFLDTVFVHVTGRKKVFLVEVRINRS
jgi:hypothetical protein